MWEGGRLMRFGKLNFLPDRIEFPPSLDTLSGVFFYLLIGLFFAFSLGALIFYFTTRKDGNALFQLGITKRTNVGIVFAHPDDDAMFFAPTALALQKAGVNTHFLCFSTGNFDGLGPVREKEIKNMMKVLDLESLMLINDEKRFPDGQEPLERHHEDQGEVVWSEGEVAKVVEKFVRENKIDVLLTFDEYGVSHHINHVGVYDGVRHWVNSRNAASKSPRRGSMSSRNRDEPEQTETEAEDGRRVILWQLESVSMLRKYSGLLDFYSIILDERARLICSPEFYGCRRLMQVYPSQFVWFRHLWTWFSRYAYYNTYKPLRLFSHKDIELQHEKKKEL